MRLKSDPRFHSEFARIEQTYGEKVSVGGRDYPGFWRSPAGRKAADGQVVTVGKVRKWVVISDDKAVRYACLNENVECIGWPEFARRLRKGELGVHTAEAVAIFCSTAIYNPTWEVCRFSSKRPMSRSTLSRTRLIVAR